MLDNAPDVSSNEGRAEKSIRERGSLPLLASSASLMAAHFRHLTVPMALPKKVTKVSPQRPLDMHLPLHTRDTLALMTHFATCCLRECWKSPSAATVLSKSLRTLHTETVLGAEISGQIQRWPG